jgi:hypothetical protein
MSGELRVGSAGALLTHLPSVVGWFLYFKWRARADMGSI